MNIIRRHLLVDIEDLIKEDYEKRKLDDSLKI